MAYQRKSIGQSPARLHAIANGYASGLEEEIVGGLKALGVSYTYEAHKLTYEVPSRPAKYTPDFVLGNHIVVETKGRFVTADRQKMILVKKTHPDLEIRLLFSNSKTRISKQSKTTYAMWCDTHGFVHANVGKPARIPQSWIDEPSTPERSAAVASALTPSEPKRKKATT